MLATHLCKMKTLSLKKSQSLKENQKGTIFQIGDSKALQGHIPGALWGGLRRLDASRLQGMRSVRTEVVRAGVSSQIPSHLAAVYL